MDRCARVASRCRNRKRRENKRGDARVSRPVSDAFLVRARSVRPLRERVPRVRIARPAVGDDRPIDSGGGDDVRRETPFH